MESVRVKRKASFMSSHTNICIGASFIIFLILHLRKQRTGNLKCLIQRTSLVAPWLILNFPVFRFSLCLGSEDPTCLMAKKPRHKNRSNIVINSVKPSKSGRHEKRIFKKKRERDSQSYPFIHSSILLFFEPSTLGKRRNRHPLPLKVVLV